MVVRFVCVIRVPVCARVPRVCPGSPRCLFPFRYCRFKRRLAFSGSISQVLSRSLSFPKSLLQTLPSLANLMNAKSLVFDLAYTLPRASLEADMDLPQLTRGTHAVGSMPRLPAKPTSQAHRRSSSMLVVPGRPSTALHKRTHSSSDRPSSAPTQFHREWELVRKERALLTGLVATSQQGSSTRVAMACLCNMAIRDEAMAQAAEASGDHELATSLLAAATKAAAARRAAAESLVGAQIDSSLAEATRYCHCSSDLITRLAVAANEAVATRRTDAVAMRTMEAVATRTTAATQPAECLTSMWVMGERVLGETIGRRVMDEPLPLETAAKSSYANRLTAEAAAARRKSSIAQHAVLSEHATGERVQGESTIGRRVVDASMETAAKRSYADRLAAEAAAARRKSSIAQHAVLIEHSKDERELEPTDTKAMRSFADGRTAEADAAAENAKIDAAAKRQELLRELLVAKLVAEQQAAAANREQHRQAKAAKAAAESAKVEAAATKRTARPENDRQYPPCRLMPEEASEKAARRCREREVALELKQQINSQRREREKRAADEARLEAAQRRFAELTARGEQRQAAQQAALERRQIEMQRVALSAACAELTAGCPAGLVQQATELGDAALDIDVEQEMDIVLERTSKLCTALKDVAAKAEAKTDASEASCVVSWSLVARFAACHRRQVLWRRALKLPPPPVIVLYHGTRSANVDAIVKEGFRLPDGATVKFSTNLASRHGTATIFASLSFCRALLHADGSRATFLLLGLPGDEGPIDHAQATYVFSEEAALLPCYLPQGTEHACELADLTREVARACLNLNRG